MDPAAVNANEPRERFFSLSFFWGMLLVLLLLAAIFHPLLFDGKIPGDLDNLFFFYPQRALIHDGAGVFWNPYQFSGYAAYRDPVLSLFYPPSWAYRFFPLRGTYIANILGHYLYAAAGFLWLGYLLGLPRVVRLAGALSFCFGGYLLGKFLNHSLLVTATHAPWVFGAFYRGLEVRSFRWMAVASIFLALQILSGIPHTVVFMLMALGAYTVTVAALERSRYPLQAGALCVMLALGLSAVQLAPTFAGIRQGVRVTQDLRKAAEGQLPFNWVPEFILGGTDRAKEDINEYLETTCYPGVAMVLLLPFAFWGRRKRLPIFLMALFLGTVLLALGAQTFAYRTFFRLPGGNLFNIPGRFLFLASWSVPIVGMLGMSRLLERRPGDRRIDQLLWTLLGLGILLIVFLATASWRTLWLAVIRPREVAGAAFMTANLAFFGTLSLGLFALYRSGRIKPRLFGILFILVFAGDVLHFSTRLKREYVGSDVIAPTPAIKKLQTLAKEEGPFRVLGFQGNFSRQLSARETVSLGMLVPKSANYYHLEDVQGYSPLHTLRYNEAFQKAAGTVRGSATLRWLLVRDPTAPLLDLLGTRYILGEPHDRFLFGGEQILRGGESVIAKVTDPLKEVRELLLVSCLDYSSHLPQGTKVADLSIRNASGETRTVPLRAGIETADYRLAFPNVAKGHQPIRIFRSLPRIFSGELLTTQVYLSRISFEPISDPREVEFRSALRDGVLVLFEASLSGSDDDQFKKVFEADGIRLYENSGAFPRAWWVPNSVMVPPGKPGIEALVNGGFDLGATVLLENPKAQLSKDGPPKLGRKDWTKPHPVRVLGRRAGGLDLEVDAPEKGYIVAAEMDDFGWTALIDGKRAPKLRANGIMMAVPVESGKHTINLRFRPWDAYLGAGFTFVSLVILTSILRGKNAANAHRDRSDAQ